MGGSKHVSWNNLTWKYYENETTFFSISKSAKAILLFRLFFLFNADFIKLFLILMLLWCAMLLSQLKVLNLQMSWAHFNCINHVYGNVTDANQQNIAFLCRKRINSIVENVHFSYNVEWWKIRWFIDSFQWFYLILAEKFCCIILFQRDLLFRWSFYLIELRGSQVIS